MSVHEDLLNNGENNCSFTEDEVDIMCSKDGDAAYRICGKIVPQNRQLRVMRMKADNRKKAIRTCRKIVFYRL